MPTAIRFSGEVSSSSRPMKWNPAVPPDWWQPWQVPLSSRASRPSGVLASVAADRSASAKVFAG